MIEPVHFLRRKWTAESGIVWWHQCRFDIIFRDSDELDKSKWSRRWADVSCESCLKKAPATAIFPEPPECAP